MHCGGRDRQLKCHAQCNRANPNTEYKVTAQAEKERVGKGESPPEEATRWEQSGNQKRDVQRQDSVPRNAQKFGVTEE